jgi:hypothetical protein
MSGKYVRQFTGLTADWGIGSFTGASLDWLFGLHNTESHILNVFSALIQFTAATFITYELTYSMGFRNGTNTLQNTWIMYFAVWTMSPNAVRKLVNAYYAFHRILYGPESKKTTPEDK